MSCSASRSLIFSIASVSESDAGSYTVKITNGGGSITSTPATLTVVVPVAPTIISQPESVTVEVGGSAYLYVQTEGTGPIVYTWYKDGVALTDTAQKIKPTTPGSFTVKVTQNGCISTASNAYYYIVTDVINLSSDEFIKLAPNPFINQLNFDFVVKGYQRLNLEVFDIASGTKVASQPNLTAGSRITLGHLSSGTYVIRVTSTDNKISYQFKMVKL